MPSDLEQLLDMGFEKARAEIAVKKTGGLQGALQWLEDNQDKSLEEIEAAAAAKGDDANDEDEDETRAQIAELETGQARSLVCNECGKRFRNKDLASYHATKTEHADFSESTEEIAPLTEDEKKARLEELRERLKAKKAAQSVEDKEEHKRNERIRQKATKETQDAKEELQRKEQIKEAARKRAEKMEDMEAKKRIKAKIEEDKAERRRKAEEAKAAREGRAPEAKGDVTPGGTCLDKNSNRGPQGLSRPAGRTSGLDEWIGHQLPRPWHDTTGNNCMLSPPGAGWLARPAAAELAREFCLRPMQHTADPWSPPHPHLQGWASRRLLFFPSMRMHPRLLDASNRGKRSRGRGVPNPPEAGYLALMCIIPPCDSCPQSSSLVLAVASRHVQGQRWRTRHAHACLNWLAS
ncbi:hypothetical protein HIM_01105 [Hirsutella minnesotensis 3608]|nr:hypothetical protein HIM_01105 [Hirsutella minnesotensis 3608]